MSISEMQANFPNEPKQSVYGEVVAMQFEGLLKVDYEPILISKE